MFLNYSCTLWLHIRHPLLLSQYHPLILWQTAPRHHTCDLDGIFTPPARLPLNNATLATLTPTSLHSKWFRERHLTQIRPLRCKVVAEASSGAAAKDTFLEIVRCRDSPFELAAANFSNVKEPAWRQYQQSKRESSLEPWCSLEPLDQTGPEVRLLDISLMWDNKFFFCLSQFELDFLFS